MEPMNTFLNSHRQEFKTYLDNICSISSMTSPAPPIPPSYSTPLAILQRLPPTSREGFPSLPYLVDHARNFAALVDLWLENTKSTAPSIETTDGDLLKFHQICVTLKERTTDCLNRAERAERPSSSLSVKWEELVEQLQGSASFDSGRGAATKNKTVIREDGRESLPTSPGASDEQASSSSTSTPVTMKPVRIPRNRHQQHPSISASASSLTSTTSNTVHMTYPPKVPRDAGYAPSLPDSVSQSASTNASASASAAEETPPGSSDGLHMAPPPSYPQTRTHPSASAGSFTYANPNTQINMSALASSGAFSQPPRSAGAKSLEGSDAGSVLEEEYTTALPAFSKDKEGKEKKGGFRGVLPFQRKRKDKDKDKDKEKDKDKGREKDRDRDRSPERIEGSGRGGASALGEYASHSSLRGRAGAEAADF